MQEDHILFILSSLIPLQEDYGEMLTMERQWQILLWKIQILKGRWHRLELTRSFSFVAWWWGWWWNQWKCNFEYTRFILMKWKCRATLKNLLQSSLSSKCFLKMSFSSVTYEARSYMGWRKLLWILMLCTEDEQRPVRKILTLSNGMVSTVNDWLISDLIIPNYHLHSWKDSFLTETLIFLL